MSGSWRCWCGGAAVIHRNGAAIHAGENGDLRTIFITALASPVIDTKTAKRYHCTLAKAAANPDRNFTS
jgi:hypothetical protein